MIRAGRKPKVLIVDDEKLIRWTLSEASRGWGYVPLEAADAKGALELFEAERPRSCSSTLTCPTAPASKS